MKRTMIGMAIFFAACGTAFADVQLHLEGGSPITLYEPITVHKLAGTDPAVTEYAIEDDDGDEMAYYLTVIVRQTPEGRRLSMKAVHGFGPDIQAVPGGEMERDLLGLIARAS